MLLILSNSLDVTADYLATALLENGVPFVRLDTDRSLNGAEFHFDGGLPAVRLSNVWYEPRHFTNVWYRRPERVRIAGLIASPESKLILDEWSEALEGFFAQIPQHRWVNHPAANVAASHKIEQLSTATRLGFDIPRTLVTQDPQRLRAFYAQQCGRIIVKPISVGHIEREHGQDSLIYTNPVAAGELDDLSDLKTCPALFQELVPKAADVRITVVDHSIHAIEMVAKESDGTQRCDIRRDNMRDVTYRQCALPVAIQAKVKALVQHYNLRFAAIDMAVTESGEWIFFEVNPNGQWAWFDLAGVSKIAMSFVQSFSEGSDSK